MDKKGFFICIEGLDGCGTTTQAKLLVSNLLKKGFNAVYTTEPSCCQIGTFIKKFCLHGGKRVSGIVESLLFAADRFQHLETEIIPTLKQGKVVVSDRYVYSSFAYQGSAGLDIEWIRVINTHSIPVDLAIFVDVDPLVVMQRLKPEKSVMENLETQRKVRQIYMEFVRKKELILIDGSKSIKEVAEAILAEVLLLIEAEE